MSYAGLNGYSDIVTADTSTLVDRTQLPRRHFMPVEATSFDKHASITYSVADVQTDIISLTLPQNSRGVVKMIGQGTDTAGTLLAFNETTYWGLFINNVPVIDWGRVNIQRGTIISPAPVTIDVFSGAIITLKIISASTVSFRAVGRLMGWYWIDDGRE